MFLRLFGFCWMAVQECFMNSEGDEKTVFFYTEDCFISSFDSFTKGVPAKHSLEALEELWVVEFNQEVIHRFLAFSPVFESLARLLLEEEMTVYQEIVADFVVLDATQRYQKLMETRPELLNRISQHYIATFIGVSPETLSRIRKELLCKSIS